MFLYPVRRPGACEFSFELVQQPDHPAQALAARRDRCIFRRTIRGPDRERIVIHTKEPTADATESPGASNGNKLGQIVAGVTDLL